MFSRLSQLRSSNVFQDRKLLHVATAAWNSHATAQQRTAPRTALNQPGLHTKDNIGMWYKLEPDIVKQLFGLSGIPKKFAQQCTTFNETCLMVREPALTVMDLTRQCDLTQPPNKFMLYGRDGVGKSLSLLHILHYLMEDGWLLVHIPVASHWLKNFKDIVPSTSVPGRFDQPIEAATWLQHFRSQNSELLKELQLVTSQTYTWTRREATEAGSPLTALVEQGVARNRFAADCVVALVAEIKQYAQLEKCKVAFVVDGINSFFVPHSQYRQEDRTLVAPKDLTIFQAFEPLLEDNWKNGIIIGTIDRLGNEGEHRESYLPRYVLRQKGWEVLDPFVPISVTNYNELELQSAIDYYVDRQWLQIFDGTSEAGCRELAALSGHNPQAFQEICKSL